MRDDLDCARAARLTGASLITIIVLILLDASAVAARNLLIYSVPTGFKIHVLGLSFYDEDNPCVAQAYTTQVGTGVSWPFSREYQADNTPLHYQSMIPYPFDVFGGSDLRVHVDCTAMDNVHIDLTYELVRELKR